MSAGIEILSRLGEGATALVYRARVEGREVALKCFKDERLADPMFRRRLERKVQSLQKISDPHLVGIYGLVEFEGRAALVMELIEGESLESLKTRLPYLLPEIAVSLLTEILAGLQALHDQGFVHRDLKPANVFIEKSGRVVLGDFGLLKLPEVHTATLTGQLFGSPYYMSPEQSLGRNCDSRSDLFSAMALFFELITGTPPFWRENLLQVLKAISEEMPKSPEQLNPKVSRELAAIVLQGLSKDAALRPQSATNLSETLNAYLASIGLDTGGMIFQSWLRNPSAAIWDSLTVIAKRLDERVARAISQGQGAEAWSLVSHYGQVAPQSTQLAAYVGLLEGLDRKARAAVRNRRIAAALLLLLLIGVIPFALRNRGSAPAAGQAVASKAQPAPIEERTRVAEQVPAPQVLPQTKIAQAKPAPRLPKPAAKGHVVLDISPDIDVYWNGNRVHDLAKFPAQKVGTHNLMLLKPGYPPIKREIEVKKDEDTVVRVR